MRHDFQIRSGAQTGVDRGALDAALAAGIKITGWIPKNRQAYEPIPHHYDAYLKEMTDAEFPQLAGADQEEIYCARTEQNAKDGDGTLVIMQCEAENCGGTLYTAQMAAKHGKPCLILDLSKNTSIDDIINWIELHHIRDLNVGGPNERKSPGAYQATFDVISKIGLALNLFKASFRHTVSPPPSLALPPLSRVLFLL